MRLHVGVPATLTVVAALVLSACGASTDKKFDDKPAPGPSSSAPVSYEGKEVKDTGCDIPPENVYNYAKVHQVNTGRLKGELAIRSSSLTGGCYHLFWARFIPTNKSESDKSESAYILAIYSDTNKKGYRQPSAPNPTVTAFTRVTHADPGTNLKACVWKRGLRPVEADCVKAPVVE
jgi:hypothetical protein